ncbi:MAG: PglZ domain-containing protein [Chitinivibrionales bacterium]|nr:PglZ domain-containing protein [Chitinivibrionales bacterium]
MGGRKKVLWVDDEIEFLRSHIMFLETRGYSVIPVFSGDDALHVLTEKPGKFDLVLLDEQMPGKDGLTTLEEIKEMQPDLPVVMVTKSEEERLMEDAFGRKIDGYLTKPVNPSQILSVCKRLLDSRQIMSTQINQRFVRDYSENRVALSSTMDARRWIRLFNNLTKWDLELQNVEDEGLRQTHAGQRSDCNAVFAEFITEHYPAWVKGNKNPPLMSADIVEKVLFPRLQDDKKVFFIVLDCMRLDQYYAIEPLLRTYYSIQRGCYFSLLPTSTPFARNALFAGMYPQEISEQYPKLFKDLDEESDAHNKYEKKMLAEKLKSLGMSVKRDYPFEVIKNTRDSQKVLRNIPSYKKHPLVTIVVDFVDLLAHSRSTSTILKEIAPDETAFRSLTSSWFQYSNLFQILRELARKDCTVILTTDHGSTFCTRGTEVYGVESLAKNLRYKYGPKVTSDERHSIFLSDPTVYRLPVVAEENNCIIAKENYYFVHPDKFENYQEQYQNSFQHGGVSMEEMIIPLAIMEPKDAGKF